MARQPKTKEVALRWAARESERAEEMRRSADQCRRIGYHNRAAQYDTWAHMRDENAGWYLTLAEDL